MPATRLTINYARSIDIANTASQLSIATSDNFQVDDLSVTPLQLARHFLLNKDLGSNTDYGRSVVGYLKYPGGFITVGDKVNSKYSDFTVEKNLTVTLSANFNKGFDMFNINGNNANRIKNMRRISSAVDFASTKKDDELITVGDFKKYGYYKGMIVLWSGSEASLKANLPFWRLCAPPDAGFYPEIGVTVPNLQGLFIMGGSYTPSQSYDNFTSPRPYGDPTVIGDKSTLDNNTITLTQNQLQAHNHNYSLTLGGGFSELKAFYINGSGQEISQTTTKFYYKGGIVRYIANTARLSDSWPEKGVGYETVATISQTDFIVTEVKFEDTPIVITRPSNTGPTGSANNNETRGGSQPHENRPPYYALAYIMYVGVSRT